MNVSQRLPRSRRLLPNVLAAAILLAAKSNAALVSASTTIDLNTAISSSTWIGVAHPLDSTVGVSSGDTVTINIDFTGTQSLIWNGNGNFNPWLMLSGFPGTLTDSGDSGNFSWSSLSVILIDLVAGTQFPVAQLSNGGSGAIHLGPTNNLGNDSVLREFSGVTLSFVATWTDGDPVREFGTIGYYTPLFGGTVAISSIPEPSTTLLGALAGAGLLLRRRRP